MRLGDYELRELLHDTPTSTPILYLPLYIYFPPIYLYPYPLSTLYLSISTTPTLYHPLYLLSTLLDSLYPYVVA